MAKTAYLVTISLIVRVIEDVQDETLAVEEDYLKVCEKALDVVRKDPYRFLNLQDIENVSLDNEIPYCKEKDDERAF